VDGVVTPAGIERFFAWRENFLQSLDGPPSAADVDQIMEMNARYGIRPA
jgi:hypothetical protein